MGTVPYKVVLNFVALFSCSNQLLADRILHFLIDLSSHGVTENLQPGENRIGIDYFFHSLPTKLL